MEGLDISHAKPTPLATTKRMCENDTGSSDNLQIIEVLYLGIDYIQAVSGIIPIPAFQAAITAAAKILDIIQVCPLASLVFTPQTYHSI